MKKKLEKVEVACDETCEVKKIDLLTTAFGSDDMNKMVDKINELINKLNNGK